MPLSPSPSSALRAPSPSREKVLSLLETVDSATPGKSILPESTFSLGVLIVSKDPSPSAREVSVQLKEPFMGEEGILAVGHGEYTIKGIFPKRPEKM